MGTILRKIVVLLCLVGLLVFPGSYLYGQSSIVINEFMVDPPPEYVPYVELYNNGNEAVNLEGWQLFRREGTDNNGGVIFDQEIVLQPGEFFVITPDTATLEFIYGDVNWIEMTLFPEFSGQAMDEIRLLNRLGETADSLRYTISEWGGSGVALERRRADFPSIYKENWAESTAELFGTPGSENIVEREFPFTISEIQVSSNGEIFLVFNSDIDPEDVYPGQFSLDGVEPASAVLIDPNVVRLQFDVQPESGEKTVRTGKIRSLPGWVINDGEEFSFTIYDTYTAGDIVVNEIMYNPPQDYPAYVELFNRSEKYLNLRNWNLLRKEISTNPGGIISTGAITIRPGDYLVLTDNLSALKTVFGEIDAVEMNDYPGFTSTLPEQIRLMDASGAIADSLEYIPSVWGGKGIALERKSQDVASVYSENWAESPAELRGTPGQSNLVQPDSDRPVLNEVSFFDGRGFRLQFSKTIDPESAIQLSNYSLSPAVGILEINAERDEVFIELRQELQEGEQYTIVIDGVIDLFGNQILQTSRTLEFLEFDEASPGDLVINEILYRRERAGSPEFVEVFNTSDKTIDLSGWHFFAGSDTETLPHSSVLRGNSFLVLTDQQDFADQSPEIIYLSGFPGLSNTGSSIGFRNRDGITMDSLAYSPDWGSNIPGISIERRDPAALSIDPFNWKDSVSESGSTPAAENSQYEVDLTPPKVLFANLSHPDSLEIEFNKFVDLTDNGQANFSSFPKDQSSYSTRFLVNGEEAKVIFYNKDSSNRIILDTRQVIPGEKNFLRIEGLKDFKGNTTTDEIDIAQPVLEGQLVINEIMYHPLSGDSDGTPEQSEYLEIYNKKPHAISLEGIFLHDEPEEGEGFTRIEPVSTQQRWIPANGFALFYPESEEISLSESRTGIAFGLPEENDRFGLRAERTSLSLRLSGRTVYLADSTGVIIDRVDYKPEWHNPNLITTQGISLERINPDSETNNPSNWGSHSTVIGGTPMARNSLTQQPESENRPEGVTLSPNPFSPDNDGVDDNLVINYQFEDPNYMLKVRVYDRYGRLVRNLANSYAAGLNGSLVWDGRTDDGRRNRIGIYIVYVEAYNGSTGSKKVFRETVVVARQF
jgi:hypothetical protein